MFYIVVDFSFDFLRPKHFVNHSRVQTILSINFFTCIYLLFEKDKCIYLYLFEKDKWMIA